MMVTMLFVKIIPLLFSYCTCPSRNDVDNIPTVQGTWERGYSGSVPDQGSVRVIDHIQGEDKSPQYVCRVYHGDREWIPGKMIAQSHVCNYPKNGREIASRDYEILVNHGGYDYHWSHDQNGWFQRYSVTAGYTCKYKLIIA